MFFSIPEKLFISVKLLNNSYKTNTLKPYPYTIWKLLIERAFLFWFYLATPCIIFSFSEEISIQKYWKLYRKPHPRSHAFEVCFLHRSNFLEVMKKSFTTLVLLFFVYTKIGKNVRRLHVLWQIIWQKDGWLLTYRKVYEITFWIRLILSVIMNDNHIFCLSFCVGLSFNVFVYSCF